MLVPVCDGQARMWVKARRGGDLAPFPCCLHKKKTDSVVLQVIEHTQTEEKRRGTRDAGTPIQQRTGKEGDATQKHNNSGKNEITQPRKPKLAKKTTAACQSSQLVLAITLSSSP